MSSPFLEIVQLADGQIVLKRSDEESAPLVEIRFSEESKDYIGDAGIDIAKAMIQAGIQAAAHINEANITQDELEDEGGEMVFGESEEHTLH
ncbi:hypothetical protein [Oceanicoccus sagamiensis]|uniref:Uncharacterized protein n=1 Tax=Oceanicoccus sagamiensis TaxID=716816 RepID=A0A1X9NLH2_9GAMM|nr:hypothetical protein [Oceanicoccus sagamiensis]ARN75677.1 hypothetical protein BST96_17130 [Oceanicoccus sagamiensis]